MTTKKTRKTHTAEFKAEALKLAERVGVAEAARQLKIYESQLYNRRTATEKKSTTSQREADLAVEVAKLKRQLADQAEDLAILKKAVVDSSDHRNTFFNHVCRRFKFQCFPWTFVQLSCHSIKLFLRMW